MADQIVRFVAEHTRPGDPPLHVSIAGGRKTMGYLLAAAVMIHGRREDRLSHVLVHPAQLEGTDFYFPPRLRTGVLTYRRPDNSVVRVNAEQVRVDLAELPFLRLRALRSLDALQGASFTTLVEQAQADLDALTAPHIVLDPGEHGVRCSGRVVPLPPVRLAIYELHSADKGRPRYC